MRKIKTKPMFTEPYVLPYCIVCLAINDGFEVVDQLHEAYKIARMCKYHEVRYLKFFHKEEWIKKAQKKGNNLVLFDDTFSKSK